MAVGNQVGGRATLFDLFLVAVKPSEMCDGAPMKEEM